MRRDGDPHAAEERVLRAKYLDWCSAQVADQFLALSPDEIFELAQRATRAQPIPLGELPDPLTGDDAALASYQALVEIVTEVLTQQMNLPEFGAWAQRYREDPGPIDDRLLGFWRERA